MTKTKVAQSKDEMLTLWKIGNRHFLQRQEEFSPASANWRENVSRETGLRSISEHDENLAIDSDFHVSETRR